MKIIIATDDCRQLNLMTMLLERRGHSVVDVISGQQAILAFDTNSDVGLVVANLRIEESDSGLKVFRYIRKKSSDLNLKLCLTSGGPISWQIYKEALRLRIHILSKPFDIGEFFKTFGL